MLPFTVGKEVFKVIEEINKSGTMILLAEQNANAALRKATRGYVVENGKIVLSDHSRGLLNNEQVKRAYIGA